MQCNGLSADEVVASGNVLGHREGTLAAVCVEDLGAPGWGCAFVAVLSDLEERASGGGGGVGDLGHVDEDGAVVGTADSRLGAVAVTGLSVKLYSEGGAGCCCQS